MTSHPKMAISHEQLMQAIQNETQRFQEFYVWMEKAMPPAFFEEVNLENLMLVAHSLMGFDLQEYFSTIYLKSAAITLCLNSDDADLRILKNYSLMGIKSYQTFVSSIPLPYEGVTAKLRVAIIYFTGVTETSAKPYPEEDKKELHALLKQRNPNLTDEEFNALIASINSRFLRSMPIDRLILVLDMFFRARTRDSCQYEVRYNENWEETGSNSMQIVLAWRNTPKHNFLYRLARTIHRHHLVMGRVSAAYIDPYSQQNILLMSINLHGANGRAVWEVADIPDFLRELVTLKYFASFDEIDEFLVSKGMIGRNMANVLRAMENFVHQALVHVDPYIYTNEQIVEAFCRHPELTVQLCEAFKWKFHPELNNYETYLQVREQFLKDTNRLDTGQEENDIRRRNIFLQAMNMVHRCYKTNAFRTNFTGFCFRMDPKYLDEIPFKRQDKFPVLPYAIYYMKGMHFFGFHIRFKDLARGGLRTVFPNQSEHLVAERNTVFTECYNLALTQQKKNKDIPEGGAKGLIFLKPYDRLSSESLIFEKELQIANVPEEEIAKKVEKFLHEQKVEYLYQAQRSYIESLVTIVNCDETGRLKAKHLVDYWKRPEYIYLGPDENMHDCMIEWIADYAKKYNYRPGSSFISGKPDVGINHKEYGVTSLGLNVYMDRILRYLQIDPTKQHFTVKMTGGPDGDVAGNQILNLLEYYPDTAKLVALTDGSGTIYDHEGLNLEVLADLFYQGKAIRHYPPDLLHDFGFLLDRSAIRSDTKLSQQTLCWRKRDGNLIEDWLSGSDMNHLIRHNVHQSPVDVFLPCGGRPRTLNEFNVKEFLDETGKPTAKAIVEGANLYLNDPARKFLEEKGVLIVKDSSANKCGVICSSFEILSGLTLGDALFMKHKDTLTKEVLQRLQKAAANEAELLIRSFEETGTPLTQLSDQISHRINEFTYQILDHLDGLEMPADMNHPLNVAFFSYCPPTLTDHYKERLLENIPDHHKKAIIACHIGAQLVYRKGLNWFPSIIDILPVLLHHHDVEI